MITIDSYRLTLTFLSQSKFLFLFNPVGRPTRQRNENPKNDSAGNLECGFHSIPGAEISKCTVVIPVLLSSAAQGLP